jgi:hypothetical protein
VSQSFETEAEGFTFTFQPKADSESEVEFIEQANNNDQSDEESETSFYLPSSEPTPPPSPCAPSHPTTPPRSPPPPQPELKPADVLTGSKRNQNSSSPEPKKVKKKTTSAIRHALELSTEAENGQSAKHGLLKYFSKGTQEDRKAYFLREDERSNEARLQEEVSAKNVEAKKKVWERELARERQRKHRQVVKAQEIRSGQRSPGGTKRKVSILHKKKDNMF